jgi:hypothetical protein
MSTLLQRTFQIYGNVNRLLPAASMVPLLPERKNIHISPIYYTIPVIQDVRTMGLFERFCRRTGILDIQKYVIKNF